MSAEALDAVEEFVKLRSLEFARAPEELKTLRRVGRVARDLGKWLWCAPSSPPAPACDE